MSRRSKDRNANDISGDFAFGMEDGFTDGSETLSADFRLHIGLLSEEEEGLSERFKAAIGMSGPETMNEISEVDLVVEKQYECTLKGYRFEKYAKKHFQGNQSEKFTRELLGEPLLPKKHTIDATVSLRLWEAIVRFMDDSSPSSASAERNRQPVMSRLFKTFESQTKRKTSQSGPEEEFISVRSRDKRSSQKAGSEKRKTWRGLKKLTRTPSEQGDERFRRDSASSVGSAGSGGNSSRDNGSPRMSDIPNEELDLVQYIVGHGILRRDLRDEIYCQLCKQVRQNPSREAALRGWLLLSLCAGCFLPSEEFQHYLQSALRDAPKEFQDYSMYTRRIMKRTITNGPRYHPPNWLEIQATKMRRYVLLPVALPDGTLQSVEADSAITASEVAAKVCSSIDMKDTFGFAVFICIFDKVSSLGSGGDHVMDAICECEQLMRSKGKLEADAPWRLYFRKELFTPWYNPESCSVTTELIYRQVAKGIRTTEYKTRDEDELARFIARSWYIENGNELVPGKLQAALQKLLPKSALAGGKSRDGWTQAILASFAEQGLDKKSVSAQQIKCHIVGTAPLKWPLQFSGLFEAYRVSGPRLPRNDVVLAVSSRGLFVLDEPYRVVLGFRYYEIVEVFYSRSTKSSNQTLNIITVKGDEFSFLSPNADTVTRLVTTFLGGLRQRSKFGVGLQDFILEDATRSSTFQFRQGDVIELLNDKPSRRDWITGRIEETGVRGELPLDTIYVLPTMEKPPANFLHLFKLMSATDAGTLPRKRGALRLDSETKETSRENIESAA